MRPTELLQDIRKMRFEEAYEGWNAGRLTQGEASSAAGASNGCVESTSPLSPSQATAHRISKL